MILRIVVLLFPVSLYSQGDPSLTDSVVWSLQHSFHSIDHIQYETEMRFKGYADDTFEIRKFQIQFRKNIANHSFGYDWKIKECNTSGACLTMLFTESGDYYIYHDDSIRNITHSFPPVQPEPGSYTWTMRDYFLLDQVIFPFTNEKSNPISIADTTGYWKLFMSTGATSERILTVDKSSHLPAHAVSRIWDQAYDVTQTLDISFYFSDNAYQSIPDSSFTIEHLLDAGYKYQNPVKEEKDANETSPNLSASQQQLLLQYPFITGTGDTFRLSTAKSSYILLDFWFLSCKPCLESMPAVDAFASMHSDSTLSVMGINCIDNANHTFVSNKIRKAQIQMPLLFGERKLLDDLSIPFFPCYVLIMPDRQMVLMDIEFNDVKSILEPLLSTQ